jgi:AAHS family 4-hydroxybenzoate transporter-like MFS transporter
VAQHSVLSIDRAIDARGVHGIVLRVVGLCTAILALDGYDTTTMGFAIPSLAGAWGRKPAAFTQPLVAGSVGMLLGALIAGPVADRVGRKPVLLACVIAFAIFSLLSATSDSLLMLTCMRFLTGLGLGGAVPTTVSLVADYSPGRRKAALVAAMTTGIPVGSVLSGLVAARVLGHFGWQSLFIIGGILPLILLPVLLLWLPESVHFIVARNKTSARNRAIVESYAIESSSVADVQLVRGNPVLELFKNGLALRTLLLWTMFVCNFLAVYIMLLWLPSILHLGGASGPASAFAATMFPLGALIGGYALTIPIDRFGAPRSLVVSLLVGACAVLWLAHGPMSYNATVLTILCAGLGIGGSTMGMNGITGLTYPPFIRATGSGWATGIGRLGNILGPLVGGILLGMELPPTAIFTFTCYPVIIAAIATAWIGVLISRSSHATPVTSEALA